MPGCESVKISCRTVLPFSSSSCRPLEDTTARRLSTVRKVRLALESNV